MAEFNYTQKINTLTTAALDEATRDLANLVNEGGEKLLKKVQSKGRIFVVNDAEKVKHPVFYGSGNTLYFDPGTLAGATSSNGALDSATADEIMAFAQFHMYSATRNINYPQAMPPGNFIPYVSNAIKMHMMDLLNKEERQLLNGTDDGSDVVKVGPLVGDNHASAGLPMSLPALLNADNSITFAGLDVGTGSGDFEQWRPTLVNMAPSSAGAPTFAEYTTALDDAILSASFTGSERPDWILTTKAIYSDLLTKLREKSQINDAVLANLGTTDEIPYAGCSITWSRYLANDTVWDVTSGAATEAPILGLNTNSLRLNVVAGGGVSDEKLGFVQKVGPTQKYSTRTNVFDRVQYKRCWSVDGGRRSFFQIEGTTK